MSSDPHHNVFDVAIVGMGPAGIAVIDRLQNDDGIDAIAFDKGPKPENRSCSIIDDAVCLRKENCNIIAGFGGSSLLSGGKLSTLPAGNSLQSIHGDQKAVENAMKYSLEWFSEYLDIAEPNIPKKKIEKERKYFENLGYNFDYYDAHVIQNSEEEVKEAYSLMLSELKSENLDFKFNTEVVSINDHEENYRIVTSKGKQFLSKSIVLAVGLPGRDILSKLCTNLSICPQPSKLEIGVRIEFPTHLYPSIDKGHKDLKLHNDQFRTFCVSKGGQLAPFFQNGVSILDGHVDPTQNTNLTNLGFRYRLKPDKSNKDIYGKIVDEYKELTDGVPVRQSYSSYISNDKPEVLDENRSSINYWRKGDINELLPQPYDRKIRKGLGKFTGDLLSDSDLSNVSVYAPEIYFPGYNYELNHDFSLRKGLYVVGDSTGHFRGILQAFASGYLCGESLLPN